jgi:hypothetical protein
MSEPKSYGAISPDQIIELFEMRARLCDLMANSVNPAHKAEASVWKEAADILRRTEFVGWKV